MLPTIMPEASYIKDYFDYSHTDCPELACFSDGASLLADTGEKDLLFLDVEMPGMNGIYVGTELNRQNPDILIFIVTSSSEYLDATTRFQVFRFLTKPLNRQRFFRNMEDAMEQYYNTTIRIPIETKDGVHTVPASAIISIEAQKRKVVIHTTKCDYESIHNMQYWLEQLPGN